MFLLAWLKSNVSAWLTGGTDFQSHGADFVAQGGDVLGSHDLGLGVLSVAPDEEGRQGRRDVAEGVGLTIALRAVELHGGQVRACNAEGGGLLIEFRLPLGEARA